jgi:hypothetical protein
MNDLFVGAGQGFGQSFKQARKQSGQQVFEISSSVAIADTHLTVDWSTVNEASVHRFLKNLPQIDLVFFNQNGSSLSARSFQDLNGNILDLWQQISHWRQSYFVSCQLPFQIIQTLGDRLTSHSRICFMLSSTVVRHSTSLEYADYIGNKFQNYLVMKNFARSHPSTFLGIDPGSLLTGEDFSARLEAIQNILVRPRSAINGKVFDLTGNESSVFRVFDQ